MAHLALILALAAIAVHLAMQLTSGRSRKFDVKGKFCYIPGGSAGLGKALAASLVTRGAHVVIVARGAKRSDETITELRALAGDPARKIFAVSADLTSREDSERALNTAVEAFGGRAPDYVFLCAGSSKPQLFVEASSEDLKWGLDGVYWVSAWTAHAVVKMMVRQGVKGSITFVSSFVGYTAFAGYSTYSPGKFALRGLADSLRSEMQLHDIDIHLYMPAGILSPGYQVEMQTKHAVTRKIEEDDTPITPEAAAKLLVKGLERGQYQITNDFVTDLVRVASKGAVPGNGVVDLVYGFIAWIGLPIWRRMTDSTIRGFKDQVHKDLKSKGFFETSGAAS